MILTRRLLLTFGIWVGALFVVFFLLPAAPAEAGPIEDFLSRDDDRNHFHFDRAL